MTDTVHAIVTRKRGINHAGRRHEDGETLTLPANQFEDWNAMGWVERAPAEKKPEPKAEPKAAPKQA